MVKAVICLAALVSSGMAWAAQPGDAADIRCFIVAAEMADTKDKDVETAASIMLFYYLGKITGRDPGAKVEALVEREAATLGEDDKKKLLVSCSAEVEQRGKQLSGSAQ